MRLGYSAEVFGGLVAPWIDDMAFFLVGKGCLQQWDVKHVGMYKYPPEV